MRIQRRKVIDENNIWSNHAELKQDFPSADYVGEGRYVFNIKGNNYRMVVMFKIQVTSYCINRKRVEEAFFKTTPGSCLLRCKRIYF